jgi:hypothetical protein
MEISIQQAELYSYRGSESIINSSEPVGNDILPNELGIILFSTSRFTSPFDILLPEIP